MLYLLVLMAICGSVEGLVGFHENILLGFRQSSLQYSCGFFGDTLAFNKLIAAFSLETLKNPDGTSDACRIQFASRQHCVGAFLLAERAVYPG